MIAILDIDGTLVDTNYQHTLAWYRAFVLNGVTVPAWRLHRHIGMGGDQLVAAVAGDRVEREKGDDIRTAEKYIYGTFMPEVRPMPGARELIDALVQRSARVVLASSAKPDEAESYIDLLGARDVIEAWTDSGDVDRTKPFPDLVEVALRKLGEDDPDEAFMVGDSVWDCRACERAGITCYALLSGGFSIDELKESGAAEVLESLEDLTERVVSGSGPTG